MLEVRLKFSLTFLKDLFICVIVFLNAYSLKRWWADMCTSMCTEASLSESYWLSPSLLYGSWELNYGPNCIASTVNL